MKRTWMLAMVFGLAICLHPAVERDAKAPIEEWPAYGNDAGSSRYSPLREITKDNVGNLQVAWTYHTGDVSDGKGMWNGKKIWARSTFENTPLMFDGSLFIATPFNRIVALDPETGKEKWVFDPKLDRIGYYGNDFTCRGLATWSNPDLKPGDACRRTLYEATLDSRLIAVDAKSGTACAAFGKGGEVALKAGIKLSSEDGHVVPGEYYFTSAPAVVGDVVVVGSAINDNDRVEMPSGLVRGYNARSGELIWSWDPVPRDASDPARAAWKNGADRTGAGNVWGPISTDPASGLVFLPTTSPSPDHYGGERKGDGRNADSLVALRASTGKLVWAFQAVHHNVWDYDLPSGPTAIEVVRGKERIAALAQPSKMGFLFVLARDTGRPVLPVEERPVPQDGVPGEMLSPTQPFPVATPSLVRTHLDPEDAWGLTPYDRGKCRDTVAGLRHGGIFTPPSLQGTLEIPGIAGGTNWGGASFDRAHGLIVLNQTNSPFIVQLIPRDQMKDHKPEPGWEYGPMKGTPYVMRRKPLLSPWGFPCSPPPWGTLAAVEANTGKIRWQVALGTTRELAPVPVPLGLGMPNTGGPLTTAGGLTFIGASFDSTFRAFDTETGRELWHSSVPASANATPMTYRPRPGGRQYVVAPPAAMARWRESNCRMRLWLSPCLKCPMKQIKLYIFLYFTATMLLTVWYIVLGRIAMGEPGNWQVILLVEATGYYGAAALLPAIFWNARRFPLRLSPPRIALQRIGLHLAALLSYSIVHTLWNWGTRIALYPLFGMGSYHYGRMPIPFLAEFPVDVITYTLWVGAYAVYRRWLRANDLERQLASAQLENLSRQLQPHFLFNALNAISGVMYEDLPRADQMLERLCDFLRATLRLPESPMVPVSAELLLVRQYLAIMQSRFEDRLRFEIDCDPHAEVTQLPALLLQPLVENAIEHGQDPGTGRLDISIIARRDGPLVHITIRDHGTGPACAAEGQGLRNAQRRLRTAFGDRAVLTLNPHPQGGALVEIYIPA